MELQGANPRIATPLEIHKHWHRGLGATELQGTMLTTQALEYNKKLRGRLHPRWGHVEHSTPRTFSGQQSYRRLRKEFQTTIGTTTDPDGEVVNLSTKRFTKYEYKLLNKNLSFCPRPNQFNRINFNKDLQAFFRRIKVKAHFADNTPYEPTEEERFGPEKDSTWAPDKVDHTVETFIAAVSNDLEDFENKKLPKDNLSKNERNALENLKNREDIVTAKADEGDAVVTIDVEDYKKEADSQLNNEQFYKKLKFCPTEGYANIVNNMLDELNKEEGLIEEIAQGLKSENPRTARF